MSYIMYFITFKLPPNYKLVRLSVPIKYIHSSILHTTDLAVINLISNKITDNIFTHSRNFNLLNPGLT